MGRAWEFLMIMVTPHEKNEWSRFAQAAYEVGHNDVGTRFSVAASTPAGAHLLMPVYDELMGTYRGWLVFNEFPAVAI